MSTDSFPQSDARRVSNTPTQAASAIRDEPGSGEWLDLVARQVTSLRFGTVQIVVHDGRVTQVESTEKIRLAAD